MARRPDIYEYQNNIVHGIEIYYQNIPTRMYLTAERALNKDDTHSTLYWGYGIHSVGPYTPSNPDVYWDERGRVIYVESIKEGFGESGWIREDELNVPLNIVPLKYYTIKQSDVGKFRRDLVSQYGITVELLKFWNNESTTIDFPFSNSDIGKTYIVEMGFPPTSDANLFRNEYLENNRYQNASQSQMVSVKLQGRPNTRYLAKTSAPRNPESNNHEVFIGLYPSQPNQNVGFSVNEDMVFITDHKGEIELSFYDSELSGVNADYLDFLDYTYWVEILVHPNQVMTVPPDMTLQAGNASYGLYEGDNLESGLELKPGVNEITITGKGKISFYWNDEVMG